MLFGYFCLLINRLAYLSRNYFLEKKRLEKEESQEIGLIKARHAQSNGLGYSSILEGNVVNLQNKYSIQLKQLQIKFQYDFFGSLINCILDPFLRKL